MNTYKTVAPLSFDERVEHRLAHLSEDIANRIRALKGDMLQGGLADKVGKSNSTVSNHLSGGVNLTLRTIAEYEAVLDGKVLEVPHLERPKRRRRSATGTHRVSDQRRALEDIDPATRRLHRLLTDVSARIGQVLDAREDLTQQALADRMGKKDASYVSRVLGGGVNLTLKTIAQFEEALGDRVICVVDPSHSGQAKGQFTVYASMRASSDGGRYVDVPRTVTGAVSGYVKRKQEEKPRTQKDLEDADVLPVAA